MKIATFNVNSIRARLPRVLEWLEESAPDVVCLQEIKCQDHQFPELEIAGLGYNIAVYGQKAYNGVAILSKHPIEDEVRGLEGDASDEQARYLEVFTGGVRVGCLYLPNGNPLPGPKFDYKLKWMERLNKRVGEVLKWEEKAVFAGDFNVCPKDEDCYDPDRFRTDALCMPETRARFRELMWLGLTDALRQIKPSGQNYTYWDMMRGAWPKDNGLRIDHLLLSPQAADALKDCQIDRKPRGLERPSDHTPIWVELG